MKRRLPNLLTVSRVFLAVAFIICIVKGGLLYLVLATVLFILASMTDYYDGYFAKKHDVVSNFGKIMDPIADKILLISCFATLAFVESPSFSIPRWFVILMLCKELIIFVGAFIMYLVKGHLEVRPTVTGKASTVAQVCFIIWLFACYFFGWVPIKTYYIMLTVVSSLVLISFVQYLRIGIFQWKN